MPKTMHLHLKTDKSNSECSVDTGVTEDEYNSMPHGVRHDLCLEFLGNIGEMWMKAHEVEGEVIDE